MFSYYNDDHRYCLLTEKKSKSSKQKIKTSSFNFNFD